MAQQADGTVYIDTLMDTTGMKAGGKEVEAAVKRMVNKVSEIGGTAEIAMQKAGNAFIKQNQAVAQQEQKIDSLKRKLDELKNEKIPTDGYKLLDKELNSLNVELDKVKAKQKEWIDMGFPKSDVIAKTKKEYDAVANKIDAVKAKQKEMVNAGTAYTAPDTSATEQKLFYEQQRLQNMTNSLSTSYASLKNKVESYGQSASNAAKKQSELTKENKKLERATKFADVSIGGFGRRLNKGIFTVLKYTVGIRSLYVLTRRLRTAITDGFKNLAQYSGVTNASISSVMSALTRLKNSLATAFAPILNVVAPILTKFINMLSNAVTYIGMFIAALTGQKTFTRAKAVQEDYAASLGDTADAAKKAKKETQDYLSGLDEVRKFETPDTSGSGGGSGGGGGGVSPQDMFEEVEIPSKLQDFVDKIKEKFTKAAEEIKEGWDGAFVADTDQLEDNIDRIRKANEAVWDSPEVNQARQRYQEQSLQTFGAMLGSIASVTTSLAVGVTGGIASAMEDLEEFNKLKLTSIFNNLTNLAKTTEDFADAVAIIGKAFESPGFQKIVEIVNKVIDVTVLNALDFLTGLLSDLWKLFVKPISDNAGKIEKFLENVFRIVSDLLAPVERLFDKLAKNSKAYEDSAIHKFFENLSGKASNNMSNALDIMNAGLEGMIALLEGKISINDIFKLIFGDEPPKAISLILKGLQTIVDLISGRITLGEVWEKVLNLFSGGNKNKTVTLTAKAKNKNPDILDLIQSAWESIKDKTANLVASTREKVAGALGTIRGNWEAIKNKTSELIASAKNNAAGVLSTLKSAWETIKNKTAELVGTAKNNSANVLSTLKSAWQTILSKTATLTAKAVNKNSKTLSTLKSAWSSIKSKTVTLTAKILSSASSALKKLFGLSTGGIYKNGKWQPIEGYASGGNPRSARLFYANENGIPELIGRIGHATAVMNNGQIVASVAAGVYQAVVAAFGRLSNYFASISLSLSKLPDALQSMQTYQPVNMPAPIMAQGTVIPPKATVDSKSVQQLQQTIDGLNNLINRLNGVNQQSGNNGFNGTIRVPIILDGRQIFEAVIDEAKMKQMVSGRNPFEMA